MPLSTLQKTMLSGMFPPPVMVFDEYCQKYSLVWHLVLYNVSGPWQPEAAYHNALYYELQESGLRVQYNASYPVEYKSKKVGEYYADLVVDNKIIIEVKSVSELNKIHQAQLVNYLHISGLHLGLPVNFHCLKAVWQRFAV